MPAVITRNGSRVLLGAALVLTLLVLLGTALIAVLVQDTRQGSCGTGGLVGGRPGPGAETIPARLMALYVAAERAYGVPWNVLAAINKVETDFGRNLNVSSAGAIGWMQFMPDTWARYGVDGNDDGEKDPDDPEDAIPSAANYLRASGAARDLHAAILAYNHAEWYYEEVISWARRFVLGPMLTGPEAAGTDAADDGTSGTASYPLARRGPIIATPADHRARPLGNWQSDNAIDVAVPAGTEVLAVGDGTVERTGGSAPRRGGGVIGGYNVTLRTADNGYFYAHMRRVLVRASEHVKDGQVLGESGYANGVDHLHFAVQHGDPMTVSGETASTPAVALACTTGDGGLPGKVEIAPGANLPGRPITPETLAYLATVASIYGKPLVVTTGTNHSYYTVNGTVSDHASGHAADIGMAANGGTNDGLVGDQIMTACLIAAGIDPNQAARDAQRGGLYTLEHDGLRIQCIWKTDEGGNHHGHDHIGARPAAT
jgi:murein DD-endopeptidase MepM/ murein hydrolase activator NlpD